MTKITTALLSTTFIAEYDDMLAVDEERSKALRANGSSNGSASTPDDDYLHAEILDKRTVSGICIAYTYHLFGIHGANSRILCALVISSSKFGCKPRNVKGVREKMTSTLTTPSYHVGMKWKSSLT